MTRKTKAVLYSAVFMITAISMVILCYLKGVVPFGSKGSMAIMDAQIQYLDFFAYLKDVLNGTQKISYTFNRTLGGNNIAVLAYYLSSPFNLLAAFFRKDQLQAFFTVIVILKLSMASMTCSIFLRNRFKNLETAVVMILSLGYGMMQYNIAQASNIMWLDGVYMLPLILLGVHQLVNENKKALLMAAAGIALVFNWYSAAIDFLFSVIWFMYEVLLITPVERSNIKKMVDHTVRYCIAMGTALMIGAFLFLPAALAMSDGKGKVEWIPILGIYGWGNIFSFIQRFELGSRSEYGSVSLYCGSLAVIGCIAYMLCKKINRNKKILHSILIVFVLSLFYIPVFVWGFSLLKVVGSYWYRYSYIGIITLIVVAAEFFSVKDQETNTRALMWKATAVAVLVLFFMEYVKPVGKPFNIYMTALAFIATMLFTDILFWTKRVSIKRIMMFLMAVTVSTELVYNAKLIMALDGGVEHFVKYAEAEMKLIGQLQQQDDSFYRINQTSTRDVDGNKLTANYNEGIAYNYKSISGYTSDPDRNQLLFMKQMGYAIGGDVMNVVNTSVLGADSILGVKYVLSSYDIPGLKKLENMEPGNGKYVYENPYALPMAFTYMESSEPLPDMSESNAFLYQNQVYSYLLGRAVEVNKEIACEPQPEANKVVYNIEHRNDPLYGYFEMKDDKSGKIFSDDQFITSYNMWLAPNVFYIPQQPDAGACNVHIDGDKIENSVGVAHFYYTDLETLAETAQEIQSRREDDLVIRDGSITGIVKNPQNMDHLYLSVSYDKGWSVKVNGKKIKPELVGDCMMSLPLEPGENTIELKYHVLGLKVGIGLSVVGAAVWAVVWWKERKNNLAEK